MSITKGFVRSLEVGWEEGCLRQTNNGVLFWLFVVCMKKEGVLAEGPCLGL